MPGWDEMWKLVTSDFQLVYITVTATLHHLQTGLTEAISMMRGAVSA